MCRKFLTFNAYLLNSSYQIWVEFIFVYLKSLKRTVNTGFWLENHLLNLFSSAVNSQKLLCSQKAGVKCCNKSSGIQKVFLTPVLYIFLYTLNYDRKNVMSTSYTLHIMILYIYLLRSWITTCFWVSLERIMSTIIWYVTEIGRETYCTVGEVRTYCTVGEVSYS